MCGGQCLVNHHSVDDIRDFRFLAYPIIQDWLPMATGHCSVGICLSPLVSLMAVLRLLLIRWVVSCLMEETDRSEDYFLSLTSVKSPRGSIRTYLSLIQLIGSNILFIRKLISHCFPSDLFKAWLDLFLTCFNQCQCN